MWISYDLPMNHNLTMTSSQKVGFVQGNHGHSPLGDRMLNSSVKRWRRQNDVCGLKRNGLVFDFVLVKHGRCAWPFGMHSTCFFWAYIYIYWSPPPRPIRALGAGVIILDNYMINMITCSKTLQMPVKNASWMHMTLSILTFQKEKLQFPETRIWLWKGSIFSSNCKPFAWKMHLTLQKAAWEANNAICVKNICKQ